MSRFCWSLPGILLIPLLFPFVPQARAQASSAPPQGQPLAVIGYATVNVSGLPLASGLSGPPGAAQANPRHFPDVARLRAIKAAYEAESSGATSAPADHSGSQRRQHKKPTPTPTPTTAPTATITPTPTATPTPGPAPAGASYEGLQFSDSGGYYPPDSQVAAGPTYVFEAVNLTGRILTKDGTTVKTFSLFNFFKVSTSTYLSDPRVLYDPGSQRWFVITCTVNSKGKPGGWNLAVSQSSDPTGGWSLYTISTGSTFPDFPKIGLNSDKVALTGDDFSGNNFLGTEFVVLNKSELLASNSVVDSTFFAADQSMFAIEPALHLPTIGGVASNDSDDLFMAAVAYPTATSVRIWTVTGVPTSSTSAVVTTQDVPIDTLNSPPDAAQPGTNKLIVTNDDALLDAVFRDGSPYGSLWVAGNDACVPAGDSTTRSCARFIQVALAGGTVATGQGTGGILQDYDYSVPGAYVYYPAVRTDSVGDMVTVFSGSSSSQYASVYAGMEKTTDSTLETPSLVHAGTAPYTQASRWGDYSGAGVDPYDDTAVWVTGEYATTQSCFPSTCSVWGTWIGDVIP